MNHINQIETIRRTDVASNQRLRIRIFVGVTLVAALLLLDLVADALDYEGAFHLFAEATAMIVLLSLGVYLALALLIARQDAILLFQHAEKAQRDAERWKQEAEQSIQAFRDDILAQLERWGLTDAERDVALQLLQGKSFKQIAAARNVSERTARLQASSIYAKSGLRDRAELAAFFLGAFAQ